MPPVPKTASTFLMFVCNHQQHQQNEAQVGNLIEHGFIRAATTENQAFTASPSANGTNMNRNSELAIFSGVD